MRLLATLSDGEAGYPRLAAGRPQGHPLVALGVALAVFAAALVAGSLVHALYVGSRGVGTAPGGISPMVSGLVWLIGMQVGMIVLTLLVATPGGGSAAQRLHLVPPVQGLAAYPAALGLLLALVIAYNGLAYAVGATDIVSDLKVFLEMAQSPGWLAALIAVGIGAPVSEELLFRGYLLGGLTSNLVRFRGAALITTALWTAVHAGYSMSGLVEVAMVGLFLSWVLWRTGSLWVPIFCHAAYNSLLMVILLAWPTVPA